MTALATPLLLAAPSQASQYTDDAAYRQSIDSAIARVDAGTYTQNDLTLLRNDPEWGPIVPDPEQHGIVRVESGLGDGDTTTGDKALASSDADSTLAARSSNCTAASAVARWVDVWYTKKSLLGFTLYRYHQKVGYCTNRGIVTKWRYRYDYVTDADSVIYVREQLVNQKNGAGTSSAWSHMQRHIEYCVVKYGCYANTYPWSKITVRGDGSYSYTGDND